MTEEKDIAQGLSNCIRKARKEKGLTQKQLAAKMGISAVNISQLESGARVPTMETLKRISKALGVPLRELLEGNHDPDREYENLVEVLRSADLSIEATGFGEGPDEGGDHFYVWHDDAEDPKEDRVEMVYRDLLQIVNAAVSSAEARKIDFLRKRLDADLF